MKILKVVFFIVLASIPLGEIFRIQLGADIAVSPQDILVSLLGLIFLIYCFGKKYFPEHNLKKPILVFVTLGCFSLIINFFQFSIEQILVSFLYLFRWCMYALIFFIYQLIDTKSKKTVRNILIIDGIVILTFGFIQLLLYPNLRNLYYLGWDEHNYRMFSVFLDPNFLGSFLVLFSLYLLGIIYTQQSPSKNLRVLLHVVAFLTVIGILLTYSRSAIIMLFVGVAIFFHMIKKGKFVLLFLLSILCGILLLSPTFNKENTNLLRKTSSFARIDSYRNAFTVFRDNPVIGVGFNTYRYAQQKYEYKTTKEQYPSHAEAGVDSSLLFVLATTGIVGFIIYISIWFSAFRTAISKKNNIHSVVFISSFFALFINSMFINSLFFPEIMLWMWIILGQVDDR